LQRCNARWRAIRQLYQTHRRQLLQERRGKEHPDPVATTWKLSFKRVEAMNPEAAELLRWCSFLAPDAIAEWMAVQALVRGGAKRQTGGWRYWVQKVWRREGVGSRRMMSADWIRQWKYCEGIRY